MLAEMTSSEFAEWFGFFTLEPWGFVEENRRVGVLASMIANTAGRIVRRAKTPEDFIPQDPKPKKPAEPVDLVAKLKAIFGGG